MKLEVNINTDNAAFDTEWNYEWQVKQLLNSVTTIASKTKEPTKGALKDINGNSVGSYSITKT